MVPRLEAGMRSLEEGFDGEEVLHPGCLTTLVVVQAHIWRSTVSGYTKR